VRPPLAHPHVFIDAGITLMTDDDGAITAVEVTWLYDELYTLILLQDYELDPDFDGALTEAEVADTLGFDLNWNSGFEGGLYLSRGERMLDARRARAGVAELRPDGRMQTTHRRPGAGDPGAGVVEAQVYDAAFFIAFEATLPSGSREPSVARRSWCAPISTRPMPRWRRSSRPSAASSRRRTTFPPWARYFADKLVFSCAP
jgi:hypothetical protein